MGNDGNLPVAVRFNRELFAYETFEHEVVVLQTLDGTYYAFGGSTIVFWEDLVSGRSIARILSALDGEAKHAGNSIAGAVTSFIDVLMQEQILLPVATEAEGELRLGGASPNQEFVMPTFEKHVDMQDLLTLDPIHDIDIAKGWPHT